jgi:hypothetical protein
MPQITIEYMIMIPIVIMQIFLFPLTTSWIMNTWVESRQNLVLRETASYLGSSIHQTYTALSHDSVSTGIVTNKLEIPESIEGKTYMGNATLRSISDFNSSKILDINLYIIDSGIIAQSSVTLGNDFEWQNSTFESNSAYAILNAEKLSNGLIRFSFGGSQ